MLKITTTTEMTSIDNKDNNINTYIHHQRKQTKTSLIKSNNNKQNKTKQNKTNKQTITKTHEGTNNERWKVIYRVTKGSDLPPPPNPVFHSTLRNRSTGDSAAHARMDRLKSSAASGLRGSRLGSMRPKGACSLHTAEREKVAKRRCLK